MLVDRCISGDVTAWEQLYEGFHEPLTNLVRYMLGPRGSDPNLVDEITARVWYSLIADDGALLDRYDPSRGARMITYLRLLARDEIKRHFRSELRRRRRDAVAGGQTKLGELSDTLLESNLSEFSELLTPREKEFFESHLLTESTDDGGPQPSKANAWQLRHRIRSKLLQFLDF